MELQFCNKNVDEQGIDILFHPVLQDEKQITKIIEDLDYEDEQSILNRIAKEKFLGKKGQLFIISSDDLTVALLGTGQKNKLSTENWRQTAGFLVSYLKSFQATKIGLVAKSWLKGNNDVQALGQALAEGLNLASYKFDKYLQVSKDEIQVQLKEVLVEIESNKRNKFKKGWEAGSLFAAGTNCARDLVNEPAGHMTPTFLAKQAESIAKNNKNISVKILDKAQVKKMGMNAFLGVDQGSDQPLKFIHLIYKPQRGSKEKIALVGKGITFDSGGLNIKPGDSMEQMKVDMSGAATVLGVFSVLGELKPKAEVHGIVAACENMPSGGALKPGDIVRNMQGKSIEIGNTDAEGRVTLADSLAYAQKQGASTVVDLATLTGACMIALGTHYAALYANDNKLSKDLLKSANQTGEKIWSMPLPPEYRELNKSQNADVRNIPKTRYGGSITAALFLQEFIERDIVWAHLDIAGPAYAESPLASYVPIGGVGFGVRTLLDWLMSS
jgi:leucyl aminopeptidase